MGSVCVFVSGGGLSVLRGPSGPVIENIVPKLLFWGFDVIMNSRSNLLFSSKNCKKKFLPRVKSGRATGRVSATPSWFEPVVRNRLTLTLLHRTSLFQMVFDRNTSRSDHEKGAKIRFEFFSDGIVGGNSE